MGWGELSTPSRPVLDIGGRLTDRHRRDLLHGLVGDRWNLYYRSATYKATVDQLVELLPQWLDGVANECTAEADAIAAGIAAGVHGLPHEPVPPPTVGPALLARLALYPIEVPA